MTPFTHTQDGLFFFFIRNGVKSALIYYYKGLKNLRCSRKPFHPVHQRLPEGGLCGREKRPNARPFCFFLRGGPGTPATASPGDGGRWNWSADFYCLALSPSLFLLHISGAFCKLPPVPVAYPFNALTGTKWTHPVATLSRQGSPPARPGHSGLFGGSYKAFVTALCSLGVEFVPSPLSYHTAGLGGFYSIRSFSDCPQPGSRGSVLPGERYLGMGPPPQLALSHAGGSSLWHSRANKQCHLVGSQKWCFKMQIQTPPTFVVKSLLHDS